MIIIFFIDMNFVLQEEVQKNFCRDIDWQFAKPSLIFTKMDNSIKDFDTASVMTTGSSEGFSLSGLSSSATGSADPSLYYEELPKVKPFMKNFRKGL